MNKILLMIPRRALFLMAGLPLVLSALLNPGFIASDEYWTSIQRYIPAQKASISTLLHVDDVKGPLQLLPMHGIAQSVWRMGVEHPYHQYRWTTSFLALMGVFLLLSSALAISQDELQKRMTLILMGFYFAAPVILTRPMFESLSAPFLAWAAAQAVRYDESSRINDLLWGAFFGALAFCLRPQAGICALIFPLLTLFKKEWTHFLIVSLWGFVLLVLTGLPDLWIRGSIHHSLKSLISYNVTHGSSYGNQPFWYYLPLLFLMFLGPWLLSRYDQKIKFEIIHRQRAVLLMIALFIIEHSLFTHKFERFLFPLIPLIIFLLAPLLIYFWTSGRRWRFWSLVIVNTLIWIPATFSVPQGHLISLTRFLDGRTDILTLVNVDGAIEWLPEVFRKDQKRTQLSEVSRNEFMSMACAPWVVMHEYGSKAFLGKETGYQLVETFRPGLIDWLAYKVNPKHNSRRGSLVLLRCSHAIKAGSKTGPLGINPI